MSSLSMKRTVSPVWIATGWRFRAVRSVVRMRFALPFPLVRRSRIG